MKWKKRLNVLIVESFAYMENVADTRESHVGGIVGGLWRSISRGNGVGGGVFGMFRRILENGLNESCHDQWRELCEVLGFMRKPW